MLRLGELYSSEESVCEQWGIKQDLDLAVEYFGRAAELKDKEGFYRLGLACMRGNLLFGEAVITLVAFCPCLLLFGLAYLLPSFGLFLLLLLASINFVYFCRQRCAQESTAGHRATGPGLRGEPRGGHKPYRSTALGRRGVRHGTDLADSGGQQR